MGNYLTDRRLELGYTQKEIAEMVGVTEATISRWESGIIANMRRDKIKLLADALRTTPNFIMTGEQESSPLPFDAVPYNPTHKIPLLGRIAAGLPLYAEQNIEGYVWTERNHGGEYFALRVDGDSMNGAKIDDGDIIIIRVQPDVEDGAIAAVLVDDEATIKRYHRNQDTVILSPQSTNPAHQPQIYGLREHSVRILGKVVESRTEI